MNSQGPNNCGAQAIGLQTKFSGSFPSLDLRVLSGTMVPHFFI